MEIHSNSPKLYYGFNFKFSEPTKQQHIKYMHNNNQCGDNPLVTLLQEEEE